MLLSIFGLIQKLKLVISIGIKLWKNKEKKINILNDNISNQKILIKSAIDSIKYGRKSI